VEEVSKEQGSRHMKLCGVDVLIVTPAAGMAIVLGLLQ